MEGRCGIDRIDSEEFKKSPIQIGAVPRFEVGSWLDKVSVKTLCNAYALSACKEALEQAKYQDLNKNEIGIVVDSCTSELTTTAEQFKKNDNKIDRLASLRLLLNIRASILAEYFGFSGRCDTILSPLGGLGSVGHGFYNVQDGYTNATVVVGAQRCVDLVHFQALDKLGLLNKMDNGTPLNSMKPYDQDSKGMVLGDGACALVLEEYEHAKRRGADILAEILGFARFNDAQFILRSDEEAKMMTKAIKKALERSNVDKSEIKYVIGEGTAIQEKDRAEILGLINNIYHPQITSFKASLGHMLAANGPTQAALGALAVKNDELFPIHNFNNSFRIKSSSTKAAFVKKEIKAQINKLLLTSISIGGNNYAMVLGKIKP